MTRSTCPSGGDETRGAVHGACCTLCRYLGQTYEPMLPETQGFHACRYQLGNNIQHSIHYMKAVVNVYTCWCLSTSMPDHLTNHDSCANQQLTPVDMSHIDALSGPQAPAPSQAWSPA